MNHQIILINYANGAFRHAQRINSATGLNIGQCCRCVSYRPKDIDHDFLAKNWKILSHPCGIGYWLWKPYFIRRSLDTLSESQWLFYCDSGSRFLGSVRPLVQMADERNLDILSFELRLKEAFWTKRDAFLLMDSDKPRYTESFQRLANFIVVRKTQFSLKFFDEFLAYAQDPRLITDMNNVMGLPNYDGFKCHRYDQSIFSLLCKRYNIVALRDPSQYGNILRSEYPDCIYDQCIDLTRDRRELLLVRGVRRTVGLNNRLGRWLLRL